MANPHGFTVASIPAAKASAERSRRSRRDAELVGDAASRSSSASSSPCVRGDDLAVGVEQHGGGQHACRPSAVITGASWSWAVG